MNECVEGLVSIIIPVYKTDLTYLENCLNSIKSQTYDIYEVILVDDGNEEEYATKLDNYINEHIKVLHKSNGGASSARNIGLEAARGEYVAFVDSDDRIAEDYLKNAVSYVKKYDIDIILGGYTVKDVEHIPDCKDIKIYEGKDMAHIKEFFFSGFAKNETKELRNCQGLVAPWAKLFKRTTIADVRFDENLILSEDNLFNLYCLDNAKSVGVVPQCWYLYSVVENSICHRYRKDALSEIDNSTNAFKEYLRNGNPEFKEEKDALNHRMVRQLSNLVNYYYCNKDFNGKNPIKSIRRFIKNNEYKNINLNSGYILSKGFKLIRILSKYNMATVLYIYRKIKN